MESVGFSKGIWTGGSHYPESEPGTWAGPSTHNHIVLKPEELHTWKLLSPGFHLNEQTARSHKLSSFMIIPRPLELLSGDLEPQAEPKAGMINVNCVTEGPKAGEWMSEGSIKATCTPAGLAETSQILSLRILAETSDPVLLPLGSSGRKTWLLSTLEAS